MRLHRRGIDQHLCRWPSCRGQGAEYLGPDAFGSPTHEAIVERLVRTVDRWRINPSPAGFQNMDNAADNPQIVNTRLATRVGRQMPYQLRKLVLVQPENIAHRVAPQVRERESRRVASPQEIYGS